MFHHLCSIPLLSHGSSPRTVGDDIPLPGCDTPAFAVTSVFPLQETEVISAVELENPIPAPPPSHMLIYTALDKQQV